MLAFRLLLFHFVASIYLQAVSAWFSLLCTETVVQKLYFYSALLLMVTHPTHEAELNLCRTMEESIFFPSGTWLIPYKYLDKSDSSLAYYKILIHSFYLYHLRKKSI